MFLWNFTKIVVCQPCPFMHSCVCSRILSHSLSRTTLGNSPFSFGYAPLKYPWFFSLGLLTFKWIRILSRYRVTYFSVRSAYNRHTPCSVEPVQIHNFLQKRLHTCFCDEYLFISSRNMKLFFRSQWSCFLAFIVYNTILQICTTALNFIITSGITCRAFTQQVL